MEAGQTVNLVSLRPGGFESLCWHMLPEEVKIEIKRLVLYKGMTNVYGIMRIIEYKEMYSFGKDWRKVIEKEISRIMDAWYRENPREKKKKKE